MTVSKIAARTVRAAIVALLAAAVAAIAVAIGASPAQASTAHAADAARARVAVRAVGISQRSGCPQTTTVAARIVANGPAVVHYHWRGPGYSVSRPAVRFRGPGRHVRTVRYSTVPIFDDESSWLQLVVTSPNRVAIRELHFTTRCSSHFAVTASASDATAASCSDIDTYLTGSIDISGYLPTGMEYSWEVDGNAVGDTQMSGLPRQLNFDQSYQFTPPPGTTRHSVQLWVGSDDNGDFGMSAEYWFTTTCS